MAKAIIYKERSKLKVKTLQGYVSFRRAKKIVVRSGIDNQLFVALPEGNHRNPEWFRGISLTYLGRVVNNPVLWTYMI